MDELKKPLIPITAGVLLISSGFLAIFIILVLLFNEQNLIFGIIGCIISIFPVFAGILAIKRKQWPLVVIGCIICLFIFIPLIIPGILVSIGFILILISKKEFQ
jgi:hypothetical protein